MELYAVEYYKWYFLEFTQNFLLETIYNVNQHYKTLCTFLKAGYMFRWKKKLKIWILSSLLWEFYHSCHPEEWVQNLRSKSLQFHRHSLWAQAKERNYHLTENLPLFMLLASSQMLFSVALSFPYKSHFPHFSSLIIFALCCVLGQEFQPPRPWTDTSLWPAITELGYTAGGEGWASE